MKVCKKLIGLLFLLALNQSVALADSSSKSLSENEGLTFWFILAAQEGSLVNKGDTSTLSLSSPNKQITYISDRPNRITGNVSLKKLVEHWGTGNDNFADDHPNAILVHSGSEERIPLELLNVKLSESEDSVEFDVKALTDKNLSKGSGAFLFIDAALAEYAVIL